MARRNRIFIAADVDRFTHDRLIGLREMLAQGNPPVKWVETANYHVTVMFLGEVWEREVVDVCRVVAGVCRTRPPFSMTLAGVGAFPNLRRPRTLIVNVDEGAEELRALHAALDAPLYDLGCYRRETRAYHPHLTLGRVQRDGGDVPTVADLMPRFAAWQGGQTRVSELLVMSSRLQADGPEYTVVGRGRLAGSPQSR